MRVFRTFYMLAVVIAVGCSSGEQVEIPEHISRLDNLKVFSSSDIEPSPVKITAGFEIKDTDELTIGRMGDIAVAEDGRIFISALQQNSILVFKPDGSYLTTLGNEGKGPGEFLNIDQLKIYGDYLFVYDSNQERINVFSLNPLSFSHTVNLQGISNTDGLEGYSPFQLFIANEETFLMSFRDRFSMDNLDDKRVSYYVVNQTGKITRKIFEQSDVKYFKSDDGGFTRIFSSPFHTKPLTVVSNDGRLFSSNGRNFLIKVYDSNGRYLRAYYYPFDRVQVTRENIRSYTFGNSEEDNEVFQEMTQDNELPKTWPVLNEILIDNKDRLWVSTIINDFEVYEWWILNKTGEVITKFKWPRNKPIAAVHNNAFFTRETEEETGIQKIVEHHVEM